jgi:hypothetical protein
MDVDGSKPATLASVVKPFAPERILFLLDVDTEGNAGDFLKHNGKSPTRFELIKQGIKNFIYAKQVLSKRHEFAIATLTTTVEFVGLTFLITHSYDLISFLNHHESIKILPLM